MFSIKFYRYVLEINKDPITSVINDISYTELYDYCKEFNEFKEAIDLWDIYTESYFGFAKIKDLEHGTVIRKNNHKDFLDFYKSKGIKELHHA